MINAFYSATSGANSYQDRLSVTANNMANASTTGYKAQEATFADLMYTNAPNVAATGQAGVQIGNGVRVASVATTLEQGAVDQTGRSLDAAIKGDGYFAVRGADGNTYYTRNGDFRVTNTDAGSYLTTANGDMVLDANMQPIAVTGDNVILTGPSQELQGEGVIHLGVVTFANPYALARDGSGRMVATADSGAAQLYDGARVQQFALEHSTVDLITEMSKLMESQRGFQLSSKIIQTADEMEGMANSLR